MLLCDTAIRGVDGKNSLIGIFDRIAGNPFPILIPRLSLYAKLADAYGSYQVRLQYVDVTHNKVILDTRMPQPLTMQPNTSAAEIVMNQHGVPVPQPGRYEFRLYLNDMFVGHTTFYAELQGA